MKHYRPESIRQRGLEKHFELIKLDYAKFAERVEDDLKAYNKVNIQGLVRLFGKNRASIEKYVDIYLEDKHPELAKKKQ